MKAILPEARAPYRPIDNDMPSGDAVEALWFGGVAIGVTFHF
jgi:hypothetical protein